MKCLNFQPLHTKQMNAQAKQKLKKNFILDGSLCSPSKSTGQVTL